MQGDVIYASKCGGKSCNLGGFWGGVCVVHCMAFESFTIMAVGPL